MSDTKSQTRERGHITYLPPLYDRYFRGYVAYNATSSSSVMADIVKKHFDSMPAIERERFLKLAENPSKNSY
ncbi:hypothetical protein [Paraflavitalea speifideaquila]|uniref:hypothetical protein n=1 Tax=Paraflavitalea speifideaquila TaxID=3076558 RepID=UPI0028E84515|nr:hypothetical protein [Paraflavitalea speifideiaquila]